MSRGNRVLIRLARRSITKAPMRSLLVVLLITLVVSVGTGVAIAMRSATPTTADRLSANFGSADFVVTVGPGTVPGVPFPEQPIYVEGASFEPGTAAYDTLRAEAIEQYEGSLRWVEQHGNLLDTASLGAALEAPVLVSRRAQFGPSGGPFASFRSLDPFQGGGEVTDIDMTNPLAEGYLSVVEGRLPSASDEIAVARTSNNFEHVTIGSSIAQNGNTFTVVGIVTSPARRYERVALVTPDGFDMVAVRTETVRYQVFAGPSAVRSISLGGIEIGAAVSKAVAWPYEAGVEDRSWGGPVDDFQPEIRIVPALVSAVLGIQMALVAATAFAVGVRRRTKEFGQLVTTGMDGLQLQRMVLFEAALLGVLGAVVGVVVGVFAVSQIISWGWISEIGDRYVTSPRWNLVDWLAPAVIGVLAAVAAAWWPARSLVKAPVTAALAGHLPAGRPRASNPRWGALIVIVGSLIVAALAASTSSDQGSLTFAAVFIGAITVTFLGTLLFIGSILTAVNQRSGQFPLLARLVVRSSDRHRSRSWMVVGAFMATLALPVLVGASLKAYPNNYRYDGIGEFDRRLVSVLSQEPGLEPPQVATAPEELRVQVAGFSAEIDSLLVDEFGAVRSASVDQLGGATLTIESGGVSRGSGLGISIVTPELAELLGLSEDLAAQVQGNTVLYLGTEPLRNFADAEAFLDQWNGIGEVDRVRVELIDGPELSNYDHTVLVSPELAGQLEPNHRQVGRLYSFDEPMSVDREEQMLARANEIWIERFGVFDMPSGATVASDSVLIQDWLMRQTDLRLHQSYQSGPTSAQLRWWSLAATGVLAGLIALITASLAAVELDSEMQSMIATGAAPVARRLMLGAQTLYHLLLAAVLAIPLALLLFYAVSRADDNGPNGVTIPWGSIGLAVVVIPVMVGGLVSLVFRNGRPAVSRRLS